MRKKRVWHQRVVREVAVEPIVLAGPWMVRGSEDTQGSNRSRLRGRKDENWMFLAKIVKRNILKLQTHQTKKKTNGKSLKVIPTKRI